MNNNQVLEIPETDRMRFEALLDEWLALLKQISAEQPLREQEYAHHNQQFRETMDTIWARLGHVE